MKSDTAMTATFPLTSDLVKRAQEGDSEAFAALFHAHKARIYSVCLRMTNNAAEAEDLTQDAFLQVFPQDQQLPWRLSVLHLAASNFREHSSHAFPQKVA